MATFTERIQIIIDAAVGGAKRGLTETGVAAETADTKTRIAEGSLKRLGIQGVDTGNLMKTALVGGAVVAGGALAKFALDGAQKFSDLTASVRGFQRISGATAEDSSRLVFAVQRLGIEPDTAAGAVGRLAAKIGAGKLDQSDYAGLIERTNDGTVDMAGTLENVSQKFSQMPDATDRAAMGMELFGKGWQKLSPLLMKSKGDLQEIFDLADRQHAVFNQDDLERGKQYALAMKDLKTQFQGIAIEAGQVLTPVITSAAKGVTGLLQGFEEVKNIWDDTTGGGSLNPVDWGIDLGNSLFGGGEEVKSFGDKAEAAQGSLKKVLDLEAAGKTNTQEYKDALKEARGATDEFAGAQRQAATDLQSVAEKAALATQGVLTKFAADLQSEEATSKASKAAETYNAMLAFGKVSADDRQAAEFALKETILAATTAAGNKAAADLGPNATAAEVAKAKTDAQRQAFEFLAGSLAPGSPLRAQLQAYADALIAGTPAERMTEIIVDTSTATTKLEGLMNLLNGVGTRKDQVLAGGGDPRAAYWPGHASGAYIATDGPAMLHRGVLVMTGILGASVVVGASLGTGGGGGNTYNVTFNHTGPLDGDQVVDTLVRYERRNGTGWRSRN